MPSSSITEPWCCSSTSITTCSYGSWTLPSTILVTTSGRDTPISKPSRRIVSISTERWSSPRPETINLSGESPCLTRSATLWISSWSRRSLIFLVVTYLPSRPAKGELLTIKVMLTVGSSTLSAGRASIVSGSQSVSEMPMPSMPLIHTISPASASSVSTWSSPK